MKLVFHQLRHEFRRATTGLVIYLVILFCNFALAAGWLASPELNERGHWQHDGPLPALFAIAYWAGFLLVVSSAVLADSPARPDRFLTTRPLPPRHLWAAKGLYIFLAAILPAALFEAASVASVEISEPPVVRAAIEHLVLCVVVAVPLAAFAALWKSAGGMILAAAVGVVSFFVAAGLLSTLVDSALVPRGTFDAPEPTLLGVLQGLLVFGVGLALLAAVCGRRGRKYRYLVPALASVVLVAAGAGLFTPFRSLPPIVQDQSRVDEFLAGPGTTVRVLTERLLVGTRSSDDLVLQVSFSLQPVVADAPDDLELRWAVTDYEWSVDGAIIHRERRQPDSVSSRYVASDGLWVSPALARAVQTHLGGPVAFRSDQNLGNGISNPVLEYAPGDPWAGRTAVARAELAGDAYRWTVAADVPLSELPAHTVSDLSEWIISRATADAHNVEIMLAETTVQPLSTRDSQSPVYARWREDEFRFLLYFPSEQSAWFGQGQYARGMTTVSSVERLTGALSFRHKDHAPTSGQRIDPEARLLIIRAEHVGRFTADWESPPVTLPSESPSDHGQPDHIDETERLSNAEFALWFDRLEKLAPDAPASKLYPHLRKLFSQVARVRRPFDDTRDPAVRYAASFVPRHLDWFLAQFPRVHQETSIFLHNVLAEGAQDEQKEPILAAIESHPRLSEVAAKRGWEKDARPAYLSVLQRDPSDGTRFIPQLLTLRDPEVDSLILDTYRANPSGYLYQTLRDVPRLADEADRIGREAWQPGRLFIQNGRPFGALDLALLQGRPEALAELFQAVRVTKSEGDDPWQNGWHLRNLVLRTVFLPEELRKQRHNDDQILNWLLRYQPGDFVYDPILHRFVLKAAPQTA